MDIKQSIEELRDLEESCKPVDEAIARQSVTSEDVNEIFNEIFSEINEEILSHSEVIERENQKDYPSYNNILYHQAYKNGLINAKEIMEYQIKKGNKL